jgi:isopentenyl-diphosphate delta-isomerase
MVRELAATQNSSFWSNQRRTQSMTLCHKREVQKLVFDAYIEKKLIKGAPDGTFQNWSSDPIRPHIGTAPMTIMIPAWVDGTLTPVEKLDAHIRGLCHKAVSVFVMNQNRVLIQQRAIHKYHTPGLWANTCCTHPGWDENDLDCAVRRLDDELGIKGISPEFKDTIEYRADVGGGLIEHEVVAVFVANAPTNLHITPNTDEVMATRWIDIHDLASEVAKYPENFTPWLRIYLSDHMTVIFGETAQLS